MRVSTADFITGFDDLAGRAASEPVTITDGGHDRLVLVSADEYARLKRGHRSTPIADGPIGASASAVGADATPSESEPLDLWGALRGTVSWDSDADITEPTGEVWDAER